MCRLGDQGSTHGFGSGILVRGGALGVAVTLLFLSAFI